MGVFSSKSILQPLQLAFAYVEYSICLSEGSASMTFRIDIQKRAFSGASFQPPQDPQEVCSAHRHCDGSPNLPKLLEQFLSVVMSNNCKLAVLFSFGSFLTNPWQIVEVTHLEVWGADGYHFCPRAWLPRCRCASASGECRGYNSKLSSTLPEATKAPVLCATIATSAVSYDVLNECIKCR